MDIRKRRRTGSFTDRRIKRINNNDSDSSDSDSDSEKHSGFKFPDKFDDKIYVTDGNEIHFTCGVSDDSMEKVKRVMLNVIHKYRHRLVLRKDIKDDEKTSDSLSDSSNASHEEKKRKRNKKRAKKVTITYVVNSPGGYVSSVMAFVDFIRQTRKKYENIEFVSVITGCVASAGTIMCIVADRRLMTKYATAMIHELSGSSGFTNYTRIKSHFDHCTKMHNDFVEIYLESTKGTYNQKDVEELEKKLLIESWLSAEQYKDFGFVDEIL